MVWIEMITCMSRESVYFWSNGPSEQWAFVFMITGFRIIGLSVQWEVFRTIGELK